MRETVRNYGYGKSGSFTSRYGSRRGAQGRGLFRLDKKTIETMANQFIVAAILMLIFIIISNINNPSVIRVIDGAKWVVETDYDFKTQFNNLVKSIQTQIDSFNGIPVISNNVPDKIKAVYTGASVMIMPVDGVVTSQFGVRANPLDPADDELHTGIDISGDEGTPIKAALDGVIIKVEENEEIGRAVRIKHAGGLETLYGHCSEILVDENKTVKQGDYIAKVGHTGNATAPHLHFEVIRDGKQVDPLNVIGGMAEPK